MYQVGQYCFQTKAEADNYLLSQIVPVVTPDGRLLKPEYQQGNWFFNGQILNPSYPECSILNRVQDGMLFGSYFIIVFAVTFAFRYLRDVVSRLTNFEPRDS